MTGPARLQVLAVDDEPPALAEIAYLLRQDARITGVRTAGDPAAALHELAHGGIDAVFLDIRMPGLDGLGLARLLGRLDPPPPIVFVTAYDDAAVDAFDLRAVDYVLKPVRGERLAEAVRRVTEAVHAGVDPAQEDADDDVIPVEMAGRTRFISRSSVRYAEAHGDYARLHTETGSHLVRTPLTTLEQRWRHVGFLRIHRSYLVALAAVTELRTEAGHVQVTVAGRTLPVSRRNARELRDALVGRARSAVSP